ncbi:MAG: hypothetical protein ABJO88_12700 [Parasphingorhabdus sp.]
MEGLAEAGSLHPEPVIIAVPAQGAQRSERRRESDFSDESEESLFSRRMTTLQKRLVSVECNRFRDEIISKFAIVLLRSSDDDGKGLTTFRAGPDG